MAWVMGRDGAKVVVVPARPVPTLSALLYLAISARQIDAARQSQTDRTAEAEKAGTVGMNTCLSVVSITTPRHEEAANNNNMTGWRSQNMGCPINNEYNG